MSWCSTRGSMLKLPWRPSNRRPVVPSWYRPRSTRLALKPDGRRLEARNPCDAPTPGPSGEDEQGDRSQSAQQRGGKCHHVELVRRRALNPKPGHDKGERDKAQRDSSEARRHPFNVGQACGNAGGGRTGVSGHGRRRRTAGSRVAGDVTSGDEEEAFSRLPVARPLVPTSAHTQFGRFICHP